MNKFVLTFDYELFGSGKGDVNKHIIEPTKKILAVLDSFNMKATFYVEQLEVDAIIALGEKESQYSKAYTDAMLIKQQVLELVKRGHDVQLHLHPQWYGANYKDHQWQLNFQWWRFSALPLYNQADGTPGKYDLIKEGKESLESLIKPIKSDYQCISFRAGGYNVGSDKDTVKALADNGIKIDSSVCPGYFTSSALSKYDYTQVVNDKPYWLSDTSLLTETANTETNLAKNSVYELPLLTAYSSFKQKLSLARLYNQVVNKTYKSTGYQDNTFVSIMNASRVTANSNYDVCLASNAEIKQFDAKIAKRTIESNNQLNIVTLIGHPKDYNLFSPLKKILKNLMKENVITVDQLCKELENV